MHRSFLVTAVSLLALAVGIGAFGAHSLKQSLTAESLLTFETGVRYHFYHAFALLITGMLYERFRNKWTRLAGYSFITGIILFSGSLYLLSTSGITKLGIITPVGGLCFIAGWIFLLSSFLSKKQSSLKSI